MATDQKSTYCLCKTFNCKYSAMKKALGETQTLRAGCSKAEPKIIAPPQTPFPGAQDGQNLISWRWSLPSPTDPVWWRLMHAISSYRGNNLAKPQTHNARPLQTGPITIHCAAKLRTQCNNYWKCSTLNCSIWRKEFLYPEYWHDVPSSVRTSKSGWHWHIGSGIFITVCHKYAIAKVFVFLFISSFIYYWMLTQSAKNLSHWVTSFRHWVTFL